MTNHHGSQRRHLRCTRRRLRPTYARDSLRAKLSALFAPRGPLTLARPRACGPFRFAPRPNERSPASLQILRPCGEPETATNHMAARPKKAGDAVTEPSRVWWLVLRSDLAFVTANRLRYSRCCVTGPVGLLPRCDITDIVRRRAYFIPSRLGPSALRPLPAWNKATHNIALCPTGAHPSCQASATDCLFRWRDGSSRHPMRSGLRKKFLERDTLPAHEQLALRLELPRERLHPRQRVLAPPALHLDGYDALTVL